MSMSVSLHTKQAEKFEVIAKLTSLSPGSDLYPIIKLESTPEFYGNFEEVTIFPSFEQVKKLHQELSKLMKEIEELENVPAEDKTKLPF
jgi:hypothetical protein